MSVTEHAPGLRDYARILWRRRWIVLLVAIVAPAVAVAMARREAPVYQATAQVLLSEDNLATALTGVADNSLFTDPVRLAQTQAELASVPAVAQGVVKANPDLHVTAGDVLGDVSVTSESDADLLDFTAQNGDPQLAARLANAYARQYTVYRREIDTAATARALAEANAHLNSLKAQGQTGTALYSSLADKVQTLRTMEALQTSNAQVVRTAGGAGKISPKPVRNGVLALALGIILGIGLAFLRETLDTRIRSAEEISRALHLPLLARLAEPPRKLAAKRSLVALAHPTSPEAEAFRLLRTNLDFVNMERGARSILVTSALQGEGKSTTAANLAVTLARAGRSVALVDLDLRRPSLHGFFDLDPQIGLTTVALGHVSLDEALRPVVLTTDRERMTAGAREERPQNGNGHGRATGLLHVLTSGPVPPDPGEFIETSSAEQLLAELTRRAQIVIVDAPPLLQVGDALTLSSRVDGIILVTRLTTLRRPLLRELHRVLDVTTAAKLGFVLAGAEAEEGYGSGGYYSYYYTPQPESTAPQRVG